MPEDMTLFGDDQPRQPSPELTSVPIADWQVDLLRKALEARGLASMEDRQRAIEAAAGRSVASLRALTHDEALRVLARIGQTPSSASRDGSAWDQRDEDTWIDRL